MDMTQSARIIAFNLQALRSQRSMSQAELARLVGVARPRISELESGRGNPKVDTIDRLAEVLGVEPYRLLKKIPKKSLA